MLFIKNLKQNFLNLLFSSFQESWPSWAPENNNEIQAQNEAVERQNLTPEQQELMDQIDALEQKYDSLQNTWKITSQISERLRQGLTSDPEIRNDPEARPTIEMFNHYRNQYLDATKQSNDLSTTINELKNRLTQASNTLEHEAGVDYNEETWEIKELDINNEELKTLNNEQFLGLSPEARLQYITKNNIDSSDVANWNIDSLEFSFTFEWEYNRELYLETTAWQVLPKEVWTVTSGWVEYTRSGLKWEFFNWNKRLTIHESTSVDISKLRTPEELTEISNWIEQWLEWYEWELQIMIAKEALSRWIEPDLVMETFESILSDTPEDQYELSLEQLFTQVERIRWDYWLDNNSELLKDAIADTDWDWQIDAYSRFNNKIDFSNIELREWEKWLLDMISIFESGWNYNSIYWNSDQSRIDFTSMTIWEVQQYQRQFVNSWQPSSAIGKYQFIQWTLKAAAESTWLWMNARFSPENQDKMGLYLLKIRWLDSFMNGSMSIEQFQLNLSKEWASLPKDMSGRSYYAWDWLNKAHLWSAQLRSYLTSMRESWLNA